ncbi:MAG: hypothetical protein M1481_00240 [Candidatus Thermoplasmatota archaeon]|nr:hypothetical protein [Candidatus Thermoplasmatota archaeon]MCL5963885.1 hypothetical protein [Candidatus Thermoplasmatota archaeon]
MNEKKVKELDKKIEQILNDEKVGLDDAISIIGMVEWSIYRSLFKYSLEQGENPADILKEIRKLRKENYHTIDMSIVKIVDYELKKVIKNE